MLINAAVGSGLGRRSRSPHDIAKLVDSEHRILRDITSLLDFDPARWSSLLSLPLLLQTSRLFALPAELDTTPFDFMPLGRRPLRSIAFGPSGETVYLAHTLQQRRV